MPTRSRILRTTTIALVCLIGAGVIIAATTVTFMRDDDAPAGLQPLPTTSDSEGRTTLSIIGEAYAGDASVLSADGYWATRVAGGLPANVTLRLGSDTSVGSDLDHVDLLAEARETAAGSDAVALMVPLVEAGRESRAATQVEQAFTAALARSPGAALVLVGPLVPDGTETADLESALRRAAKRSDAEFVDPMNPAWLDSYDRDAFLAGQPSASGQRAFAQHLESSIEKALRQR